VPSIAAQINAFIAARPSVPGDALYVVYGGANDILQAVHPDNGHPPAEQIAIVEEAAVGLAGSINALASQGARYFLVPDPQDWGEVPGCLFVTTNAVAAHTATLTFDEQLWASLGDVAAAQNVVIIRFDAYAFHWQIIEDATSNGGAVYGITNVYTPIFEGSAGSPGADPAISLFADDIHWSAVGHEHLAAAALAAMEGSAALLADCATGPGAVAAAPCGLVDHDADGDVDLYDYARMQVARNGPYN
jgi:outer membrane lipase/esterase